LALLADIRAWEELHAVLDAPGLTILDIYARDCVICRKIEPMVAAVAQTSCGVQARKVDAAALLEFAERYEVRGVPTLLLFRNGRAIDRKSGFFTATDLREWLRAKQGA
jgi:thioredoxin